MWLLFFVVVLVICALMVFLLLAIRLLTAQAKDQLNRYFLKNLETYDRLAQNKSETIDELQRQADELETRIGTMQAHMDAMAEMDRSRASARPASGPVAAPMASGASYRDADFLKDYAYVRRNMKLNWKERVRELLAELKDQPDPQLALYRGMLEKLPQERLYDMLTLSDGDQEALLQELFDEREREALTEWAAERGGFDLLALRTFLSDYVRAHEDRVYIRTGNPEEVEGLESERVHVLYDPAVHEGVHVSYKNLVYDFGL